MRIDDGFSTRVSFALAPGLLIWEKRVTPPGLDSGGPNDVTTMLNIRWRTRSPKKLITLTDMTFIGAYDPAAYEDILGILGENQIITIDWPDGDAYSFYGWLDKFIPGEIREGDQPEATVTICPSNHDNALNETEPLFVQSS